MSYDIQYSLNTPPSGRTDGSPHVVHDIQAEARITGSGDGFTAVPGRHKTVLVPTDVITAALAAGNNSQIVVAYKAALVLYANEDPRPVNGWSTAELDELLTNNAAAEAAATAADYFISVDLGKTYPVKFSL